MKHKKNKRIPRFFSIFLVFGLFLFLTFFSSRVVIGAEKKATPSATTAPTATASATPAPTDSLENIKKIIKDKNNLQKVKGAISQSLNRNFAILGEVTRISGESITIKDRTGTKILPVDENIPIIRDKKSIKIDDVAVGNATLVLGRNESEIFTPKIIYIYTKNIKPEPQNVYIGIIKKISKTELEIAPRNQESDKKFVINKNTKYTNDEGDTIKFEQIEQDTTILVTAKRLENSEEVLTIKSLVPVD